MAVVNPGCSVVDMVDDSWNGASTRNLCDIDVQLDESMPLNPGWVGVSH